MFLIFNLLTLVTFSLLIVDTFTYQGFAHKHLYIDSGVFLLSYLSLALILATKNIKLYSPSLIKINNRIIFPFLSLIYLIAIILEKTTYPNFVFTNFHIHRQMLFCLAALSGMIFYITYPHFKKTKNRIIYYLSPLLLISMYFAYIISPGFFYLVTAEDHLLEYTQFLLYFLAGLYSFKNYLIFKNKKTKPHVYLFLFLSISLFFIAFEEISWGQRIIGLKTPEKIKTVNYQQEISIHNLDILQQSLLHHIYISIGLYGIFSGIILRRLPKKYHNFLVFTPQFSLIFCFFAISAMYINMVYFEFLYRLTQGIYTNFILSQEIAETYLAFAFFVYAQSTYNGQKRSRPITTG